MTDRSSRIACCRITPSANPTYDQVNGPLLANPTCCQANGPLQVGLAEGGRVAAGSYPPAAPTDPYVPD